MQTDSGRSPAGARATSRTNAGLSGLLEGLLLPVRILIRTYRDVEESSRWGRLLLGNLWPAYLFSLPLIGKLWGMGEKFREGPTTDPGYFVAALLQDVVTLLFFTLVVALFAIRAPVIGPRANAGDALVALLGTFLLNLVGFVPIPTTQPSLAALLASTVVVVTGTGFTIWSLWTLGRCFGMFPEARGLVTRGPYRWVRHPVYLGELVSGLGLLVTRPHPVVVMLFVLFFVVQYWRTLLEDRALERAFPAQFPAFRARTGRLVPRWR